MDTELIQNLKRNFDALAQTLPDGSGIEFWFARDLQESLGYARWENFVTAIQRAIESCETAGYRVTDHFRGVTKLIRCGKDSQRSDPALRTPQVGPEHTEILIPTWVK